MSQLGAGAEFDAIRRMVARWGALASGIGDDAAVLPGTSEHVVLSVDACVEGRHFRREWMSPKEIGYRAAAAALSDLAAMAAKPIGLLLALGVPKEWLPALEDIADGVGEAAQTVGARILGGNLTGAGELSIATTVIGKAKTPLSRSAAQAGQSVFVTGKLGGAGETLRLLQSKRDVPETLRARFVHVLPRIQEALWLQAHGATAAIDVSDGLAADLGHLSAASNVRIDVDLQSIPTFDGVDELAATASGEEYELVVTGPDGIDTDEFRSQFGIPLTRIGRVKVGAPAVVLLDHGRRVAPPNGHDHFLGQ